jgi:hypothetical protein
MTQQLPRDIEKRLNAINRFDNQLYSLTSEAQKFAIESSFNGLLANNPSRTTATFSDLHPQVTQRFTSLYENHGREDLAQKLRDDNRLWNNEKVLEVIPKEMEITANNFEKNIYKLGSAVKKGFLDEETFIRLTKSAVNNAYKQIEQGEEVTSPHIQFVLKQQPALPGGPLYSAEQLNNAISQGYEIQKQQALDAVASGHYDSSTQEKAFADAMIDIVGDERLKGVVSGLTSQLSTLQQQVSTLQLRPQVVYDRLEKPFDSILDGKYEEKLNFNLNEIKIGKKENIYLFPKKNLESLIFKKYN